MSLGQISFFTVVCDNYHHQGGKDIIPINLHSYFKKKKTTINYQVDTTKCFPLHIDNFSETQKW